MSDSTTSRYWELVVHGEERNETIHMRTPNEPKLGVLKAKIVERLGRDNLSLFPVNVTVGREVWAKVNNDDEVLILGSLGLGPQKGGPTLLDDITNFRDVFMVRDGISDAEGENDASEPPVSDENDETRPKLPTETVKRTLVRRRFHE